MEHPNGLANVMHKIIETIKYYETIYRQNLKWISDPEVGHMRCLGCFHFISNSSATDDICDLAHGQSVREHSRYGKYKHPTVMPCMDYHREGIAPWEVER